MQAFPSSGLTGAWLTPLTGSQLSAVQAFPSSNASGVPARQSSTASQVSLPEQTSLSSQRLSVATFAMPLIGSQLSTVQLTPSSGFSGVFETPVIGSQLSAVQASPSSHDPASARCQIPASSLQPSMVVADVIPNPLRTNLIADAEARGCTVIDGLGMLVSQGVISIKYWTGVDVEPSAMRDRVVEVLGME